jgi:hypothetical protein
METISEAWTNYQREALPECLSQSGREVVQHAFYHGVVALLMIGHDLRQRDASSEQRDEAMSRIIDEIHEYNAGCEVKMLLHLLGGALQR